MKCPKCGYLGFEHVDRCRNCGYEFSLQSVLSAPELPIREPAEPGAGIQFHRYNDRANYWWVSDFSLFRQNRCSRS